MSIERGAPSEEMRELTEKLNELNSFLITNFNVHLDVILLNEHLPGMGAGRYGYHCLEMYTSGGKVRIDADKAYRISIMREQIEIIEKALRESLND